MTTSKLEAVEASRLDIDDWALALKEDPDSVLVKNGAKSRHRFYTTEELHGFYDPEGRKRATIQRLAMALTNAGVLRVDHGRATSVALVGASSRKRLWLVRDTDRLSKITIHMAGREYETERQAAQQKFSVRPN